MIRRGIGVVLGAALVSDNSWGRTTSQRRRSDPHVEPRRGRLTSPNTWSGDTAETPVGGADFSEFGNGPIIGVDYSWSVSAFDADGEFLAISGQVPISSR